MKNMVLNAELIARRFHHGQFRRNGSTPYITHVERVVKRLERFIPGREIIAAAWLHDVFEDTNCTVGHLEAEEIPAEVITAVLVLTKQDGMKYAEYLNRVKANHIARRVKIADMIDNLSDTPTEGQALKYANGLTFLIS